MSEIVSNCPRCGAAKVTFDLLSATSVNLLVFRGVPAAYEAFCVCRNCKTSTVLKLAAKSNEAASLIQQYGLESLPGSVAAAVSVDGYVSLKDATPIPPPEHLPENIRSAFIEGAACLSIRCFNAAGTMFRLCVDIATKELLLQGEALGPSNNVRTKLGYRLPWLFENGLLPAPMRDLSNCIKEDGNDGAHAGTLTKEDAEDLLDFTTAVLERLYTEPHRIRLAEDRRGARRKPQA